MTIKSASWSTHSNAFCSRCVQSGTITCFSLLCGTSELHRRWPFEVKVLSIVFCPIGVESGLKFPEALDFECFSCPIFHLNTRYKFSYRWTHNGLIPSSFISCGCRLSFHLPEPICPRMETFPWIVKIMAINIKTCLFCFSVAFFFGFFIFICKMGAILHLLEWSCHWIQLMDQYGILILSCQNSHCYPESFPKSIVNLL